MDVPTNRTLRLRTEDWQLFAQLKQALQDRTPNGHVTNAHAFRLAVGSMTAAIKTGQPLHFQPEEARDNG
jgi:hypothetical protein